MAITRTLTVGIKEKAKYVRIIGTGTQFQGSSPTNITLQAKLYGIAAKSYAWYKGSATTIVGTNQNFVIANNQVDTVETYKVKVTSIDNQTYEDTISITKVISGGQGKPGKIPVQREWKVGDVYRNNDDVIDYIYHRATNTWWRLKDGYNNVIASANPSNAFIQLTSMEQLAVQLIVAEQANLAGFIFKDNRLVSQNPSPNNPNLILDGVNGSFFAKKGKIGMLDIYENYLENEKGAYREDYRISISNRAETRVSSLGQTGPGVIPGVSAMAVFKSMERQTGPMANAGIVVSAANGGEDKSHAIYIESGGISGLGLDTVFKTNQISYDIQHESVYINRVSSRNVFSVGLPKDNNRWHGRTVTIMMAGNGYWDIYPGDASLYLHEGHMCGPNQKLHFGSYASRMTIVFNQSDMRWYITSINEY